MCSNTQHLNVFRCPNSVKTYEKVQLSTKFLSLLVEWWLLVLPEAETTRCMPDEKRTLLAELWATSSGAWVAWACSCVLTKAEMNPAHACILILRPSCLQIPCLRREKVRIACAISFSSTHSALSTGKLGPHWSLCALDVDVQGISKVVHLWAVFLEFPCTRLHLCPSWRVSWEDKVPRVVRDNNYSWCIRAMLFLPRHCGHLNVWRRALAQHIDLGTKAYIFGVPRQVSNASAILRS